MDGTVSLPNPYTHALTASMMVLGDKDHPHSLALSLSLRTPLPRPRAQEQRPRGGHGRKAAIAGQEEALSRSQMCWLLIWDCLLSRPPGLGCFVTAA